MYTSFLNSAWLKVKNISKSRFFTLNMGIFSRIFSGNGGRIFWRPGNSVKPCQKFEKNTATIVTFKGDGLSLHWETGVFRGTVTLSLSFRAKTIFGPSLYSQLSQLLPRTVILFSTFAEYSAYRGSGIPANYLVWYPVHVFISSLYVLLLAIEM